MLRWELEQMVQVTVMLWRCPEVSTLRIVTIRSMAFWRQAKIRDVLMLKRVSSGFECIPNADCLT